jgi:hypothetical protein
MNPKTQRYVLGVLVLLLVLVYFFNRSGGSGLGSIVAAPDAKFEALKVDDPALRVYELDKVRKAEYKGAEHNIFVYGPPKPTPAQIALNKEKERKHVGDPYPQTPPPEPPLVVPATFFGYATNPKTKNRLAFFSTPDDVFIVGEGGMLMNRYRLVRIGNVSADVEEVGSGKHATMQMTQPNETETPAPGAPPAQPQPQSQ